ncbi:MAG: GNAT family N-acetyltransferase [Nonlabens sp.]
MRQGIEIVNYCPAIEEQHYSFATRMFGNRRKRRNPEYLYWKFRGKQGEELTSFKIALSNGKIVGQLGLIPCQLNLDGQIVDSQWACDLVVDPDFRGKGVAKLLYQAAHDQKAITLGSDPSPSAEISMLRAGYKKLKSSNKQFVPIFLGLPLRMKGVNIKILDKVRNPFLKLYSSSKYKSDFEELDIIEAKHEKIFQLEKDKQIFIDRGNSFKNWRFRPFKDYYPGVKLYGLTGTGTYYSGYHHGDVYFITDFFITHSVHFKKIINHILGYIPDNIERIRFQNNTNNELLGSKLNTIKYRTETSIIYYTEDVEIDKKVKNQYFYYSHQDSDENV